MTDTAFERVCSEIELRTGHRLAGGLNRKKGRCPAHDDDKPSLSVRLDSERGVIGVTCFAGCSFEEVRDALGMTNVDFRTTATRKRTPRRVPDDPDPDPGSQIVEMYPYADESGRVLYYNVRFEPKDFRMAGPDGKPGKLPGNLRRVPYNLPKLIEAIQRGSEVWWVEGEKDVHTLAERGVVATTAAGGAKYPFDPAWVDLFAGANLVIVADKDKPGQEYARQVGRALINVTRSQRIVQSALPQAKSDITDHLSSGWRLDQVEQLHFKSIRRTKWNVQDLLDTEPDPLRWSIPGIIPEGLTLLVGAPKAGKSWMNLGIFTAVSLGRPDLVFGTFINELARENEADTSADPAPSLYLALEDPHRRMHYRMGKVIRGLGVDPSQIHGEVWLDVPPLEEGGKAQIEQWLEQNPKARVVLVDVLAKVRGPSPESGGMYQADYHSVGILKDIADQYGVSVVVTHHDRKKADDDDFVNMVSGTKGITGAADTIIYLQRKRNQNVGTLQYESRDVEGTKLDIEFRKPFGRWEIIGRSAAEEGSESGASASSVPLLDQLQRLLVTTEAATAERLAKMSGKPIGEVRKVLSTARNEGTVDRDDSGLWSVVRVGPRQTGE